MGGFHEILVFNSAEDEITSDGVVHLLILLCQAQDRVRIRSLALTRGLIGTILINHWYIESTQKHLLLGWRLRRSRGRTARIGLDGLFWILIIVELQRLLGLAVARSFTFFGLCGVSSKTGKIIDITQMKKLFEMTNFQIQN